MIRSFADKQTKLFWETGKSKNLPPANLRAVSKRKLLMLDGAAKLTDLNVPPNNKLHALRAGGEGQYAIWINDQFRICFEWKDGHAYMVEIIDYH